MKFAAYLQQKKVRRSRPDSEKAAALIKTSARIIKDVESIPQSATHITLVMLYSALRQTVEALCLQEGYKVYSHEAFVAYLREKRASYLAERFDHYRKLRNRAEYYATNISKETARHASEEIPRLREELLTYFFT